VVRQFAKLGIQIEVRATDNNQFQDKTRKGQYQVFWLGWNADYPDAENFLFLLNSQASKTLYDGENVANYNNPEYDRLFQQMKVRDDGPEKQVLIDRMVALAQQDAPWTMGFFPYASSAAQGWVHNLKPAVIVRDFGRYLRLDVPRRTAAQAAWNAPVWWPIGVALAAALALAALGRRVLQRRERLDGRGLVKP
jgi:ABC-type oligopeptide transport system substrate-binding subunit